MCTRLCHSSCVGIAYSVIYLVFSLLQGTWMLLAQWDTVHGWPYGVPGAFDYYGDIDDVSS